MQTSTRREKSQDFKRLETVPSSFCLSLLSEIKVWWKANKLEYALPETKYLIHRINKY